MLAAPPLGATPCDRQALRGRTNGLVVLTNMQWFYSPTWGRTLKVCERLPPHRRVAGQCARESEVRARQLELVEVLRRNVIHPAVAEVHVLLGEDEPVRRFLRRLPWYERLKCKLHLVAIAKRPNFVDYMRHMSSALLGRTVVFTNQDVMLGEGPWARVPSALPPRTAFFLSRYHLRVQYDVQHSLAAGIAEGLFNSSASSSSSLLAGFGARRASGGMSGTKRVCDMTTPQFAVWRRSLCTKVNFGSFDAYVLRLDKPLSQGELNLFDYPQNAWGGENLFLFLVQRALGFKAANPCVSLQVSSSRKGPLCREQRVESSDITHAPCPLSP